MVEFSEFIFDMLGLKGFCKVSRNQIARRKYRSGTLEVSGLKNKEVISIKIVIELTDIPVLYITPSYLMS